MKHHGYITLPEINEASDGAIPSEASSTRDSVWAVWEVVPYDPWPLDMNNVPLERPLYGGLHITGASHPYAALASPGDYPSNAARRDAPEAGGHSRKGRTSGFAGSCGATRTHSSARHSSRSVDTGHDSPLAHLILQHVLIAVTWIELHVAKQAALHARLCRSDVHALEANERTRKEPTMLDRECVARSSEFD
jgi:hypothetical protein